MNKPEDVTKRFEYINIWTTTTGKEIHYEDIDNTHLINILIMLSKRKEKDMNFISLCREAKKRNLDWRE